MKRERNICRNKLVTSLINEPLMLFLWTMVLPKKEHKYGLYYIMMISAPRVLSQG